MQRYRFHNAMVVSGGLVFWALFAATDSGAWALFMPLLIVAPLAPAVLTRIAEGPALIRPVIGAAPSVSAATIYFAFPQALEAWSPLVGQLILAGAALIFFPQWHMRLGGSDVRSNYVSKPTAGDGLQLFRLLPAGSGLTRR